MINKQFLYYSTKEQFLIDSGYNLNPNQELNLDTYGEIYGNSIVYIADTKEIWTHGQFYAQFNYVFFDYELGNIALIEKYVGNTDYKNKVFYTTKSSDPKCVGSLLLENSGLIHVNENTSVDDWVVENIHSDKLYVNYQQTLFVPINKMLINTTRLITSRLNSLEIKTSEISLGSVKSLDSFENNTATNEALNTLYSALTSNYTNKTVSWSYNLKNHYSPILGANPIDHTFYLYVDGKFVKYQVINTNDIYSLKLLTTNTEEPINPLKITGSVDKNQWILIGKMEGQIPQEIGSTGTFLYNGYIDYNTSIENTPGIYVVTDFGIAELHIVHDGALYKLQFRFYELTLGDPKITKFGPQAGTEIPLAPSSNGSIGISDKYAREDHTHPLQTTITGNAGTATKLQTPRKITIDGDVSGEATFDGSKDITINSIIEGCVKYTPQTLTDEQKYISRVNIGIDSVEIKQSELPRILSNEEFNTIAKCESLTIHMDIANTGVVKLIKTYDVGSSNWIYFTVDHRLLNIKYYLAVNKTTYEISIVNSDTLDNTYIKYKEAQQISLNNQYIARNNLGLDIFAINRSELPKILTEEEESKIMSASAILVYDTSKTWFLLKGYSDSETVQFYNLNSPTAYTNLVYYIGIKRLNAVNSTWFPFRNSVLFTNQNLTSSQKTVAIHNLGLKFLVLEDVSFPYLCSNDEIEIIHSCSGIIQTTTGSNSSGNKLFLRGMRSDFVDSEQNDYFYSIYGQTTGTKFDQLVFNGTSKQLVRSTMSVMIDAKNGISGIINADNLPEIPLEKLPHGALERLVIVDNQTARFNLTINDVQEGDTVKQNDTGVMYFVVDSSNLNNESGYKVYTAGAATSVPWSGITDKPEFSEIAISGDYNDLINTPEPITKSTIIDKLGYTPVDIGEIPIALPSPHGLYINGTYYDGSEGKSITTSKILEHRTLENTNIVAGYNYNNTSQSVISQLTSFSSNNPDSVVVSTVKLTFASTIKNAIKMVGLDDLSGNYYIYCLSYMANGYIAINGAAYE